MYIELHTASAFSFLEGASLPEALVDRAAELGYGAVALLDRDGVYGLPRFHKAALAAGIRPIVGAEITIGRAGAGCGTGVWPVIKTGRGARAGEGKERALVPTRPTCPTWRLPVLVESRQGYQHLCRLMTRMHLRAPKGEGALDLDEFDGHTAGLVALVGCEALAASRHGVGGLVDRLVGLFGREGVYVELQRHLQRDEDADNAALLSLASAFHVPVVATNGVRFATPADRPLFDVLTCVRHKTDLERAGRRLAANAERYLKPPHAMAGLFRDHPEAVSATLALAERLQYTMADLGYRFPEYPVPTGETMASFLKKIVDVGARERYRPYHNRARAQMARELDLIEKLGLPGYFLIVWDLVNFCRRQGILAQGRGSAANSAVCYSLGITAVDPVGMDLLFERFLSEERGEWPDIDLDLPSGDRRESVIQHVYEKYGQHGAAMTANVITYRGRSAAREVGKALGLDAAQIDRLSKAIGHFEFRDQDEDLGRHLVTVGLDCEHPRIRLFGNLWQRIQDLPRHLGQHSGGMVVCQGHLDAVVPLENASMPGRVVVQWDKDDCADMGIVKIDLLGLGMMAVLQDSLEIINQPSLAVGGSGTSGELRLGKPGAAVGGSGTSGELRPGEPGTGDSPVTSVGPASRRSGASDLLVGASGPRPRLDLWNIPPDDPDVYRMLQQADTMGVFQVESRAQMATLPRLKPARFYDIVVEVAIIRPGPIVGQMVHPYLNRRAGREPVVYPHPSLEPILARTLGVPLFQEQLLRMAMVAAGFTGGQAEELRRAFGFKRSERRMQQIEVQLREGMARKGITGQPADEIIRSISSFALYGFPESHAASFALLVYASAYLKAHYPAAFYTALLNNQPMGFYHPATLVKDAQRRGVRFAPVDALRSDWLCTIEPDGRVRLGLCYVNGLRAEVGKAIARHAGLPAFVPGDSRELRRGHAVARSVEMPREGGKARETAGLKTRPTCNGPGSGLVDPESGAVGPGSSGGVPSAATALGRRAPGHPPSLESLIRQTGLNRNEVATLAAIGALNAFGYDRREALWQVERAVRPAGALFEDGAGGAGRGTGAGGVPMGPGSGPVGPGSSGGVPSAATALGYRDPGHPDPSCPLVPMTPLERVAADYAGTSLTIGPHPMAMRRREMALRGVLRASDLARERAGRRVRVAGAVITRQRPGTAKGFVFLTLEDETGISNIIIRPDLFARERTTIIEERFLIVEGRLQNQEGIASVRAERLERMGGEPVEVASHDFY
jgi:error-prone DNA polymerase